MTVREYAPAGTVLGVRAALQAGWAVVAGVLAVVLAGVDVLLPATLLAVAFGVFTFVFSDRPRLRKVLAEAPDGVAPAELVGVGAVVRGEIGWMVVALAVFALVPLVPEVFGIIAGNAAALLVSAGRVHARERADGRLLLRSPRVRWGGKGDLDPHDFLWVAPPPA